MLQQTWMDQRQSVGMSPFETAGSGFGGYIARGYESRFSALEGSIEEQYKSFNGWPYVVIDRLATTISALTPQFARIVSPDLQRQRASELQHAPVWQQQAMSQHETMCRQWTWQHSQHLGKCYGDALISQGPEAYLEPITDHPIIDLLRKPNEQDTLEELVYEAIMFRRLTGDLYLWVIRNNVTRLPQQIYIVPNHQIRPRAGAKPDDDLQWTITINGRPEHVSRDDVIRSKKKSPWSKHAAQSPQGAGGRWVKEGQAISESRFHTYTNGGMPDIVLEYSGEGPPPYEQIKRFNEQFQQELGLKRHGGSVPIPPNFKPHGFGATAREMDYQKSASDNRTSIGSLHGVNPFVMGITEGLTYNTVWASYQQYYDITVNPTAATVARVWSELATKFDPRAKEKGVFAFYADATPQDPELAAKEDQSDLDRGVMDPDERRIKRGLPAKRTPAYVTGWIGAGRVPMSDFEERPDPEDDVEPDDDETDDEMPEDGNDGSDDENDQGNDEEPNSEEESD